MLAWSTLACDMVLVDGACWRAVHPARAVPVIESLPSSAARCRPTLAASILLAWRKSLSFPAFHWSESWE